MSDNGGKQPDSQAAAKPVAVLPAQTEDEADMLEDSEEPPVPSPAPPEDPIGAAERELQKAQDKLADARDKVKRDEEIAKALAQYEAAQVDLEAGEKALADHLAEALDRLDPTDVEKEKVGSEVWKLARQIEAGQAWVMDQREALEGGKAALKERSAARDEAKAAFDARKSQVKGVEERHRRGDAIRKEAADARSKSQRLLAYYLLSQKLEPEVEGDPRPLEYAEYERAIHEDSAAYGALNREVADREADVKRGEKLLADGERSLADLKKAFELTVRARLTT